MDEPAPPDAAKRDASVAFEPNGEIFNSMTFGSCARYEYWRVVRDGVHARRGRPHRRDLQRRQRRCGRHGRGLGHRWTQHGSSTPGRAGRTGAGRKTAYSMSPFVRKAEISCGMVRLHQPGRLGYRLGGVLREHGLVRPPCGSDGELPDGEPLDGPQYEYHVDPIPAARRHVPLLRVEDHELDRCAASIDASGISGYVLSGKKGAASDARIHVLRADPGALLVEVTDDTLVGPTGQPNVDDHLEVWAAPEPAVTWDHCIDPTRSPGRALVERARRRRQGHTRLRQARREGPPRRAGRRSERGRALPDRARRVTKAITVAYADSDGAGRSSAASPRASSWTVASRRSARRRRRAGIRSAT